MKTKWIEVTIIVMALGLLSLCFAAWDNTKPADSDGVYTWPTSIRANWDALESALGVDLIYAPMTKYVVNVKDATYGATGDGVTDDTAAIIAAIAAMTDAGVGTGAVYFPPGTYMFSNFTIPPNITLYGDSYGNCILKRIVGSVGTAIEDTGNAAKINIHDLQIHANSCVGVLLKLGYNATVWGTAGKLTNLWLREAPDYALQVNGNVGFIDTVALSGTGTNKSKGNLNGVANLITRLTHVGASADYGIEIESVNTTLTHTHCEGIYTTAAINANDDNINLIATNVIIPAGETLPSAINIPAGQYGCTINGLLVLGEAGSTTTALITDNAYSTGRTLLGQVGPSALYHYIDNYVSSRNPYVFNSGPSGAPTTGEYWKGDMGLLQETDEGEPSLFRCVTEGTPGTWLPVGVVPGAIDKTADYPIVVATDNGKRFSNKGAGATITFSLPAATVGQTYHFIRLATQSLRADPQVTETVRGGAAGKYMQLDADGDSATLMCLETGKWEIICYRGTISFE